MKINIDELINKLESDGFIPIRVIYQKSPRIDVLTRGDLDYFLKSVKSLGEKAVFISEYIFDESYFIYEPETKVLGSYNKSGETVLENTIHLPDVKPELNDFKQYIGEAAVLILSSVYRDKTLTYLHNAGWYDEFQLSESEAIEAIDANEQKLRAERETNQALQDEENRKQEAVLIEKLKALVDDEKFTRLETQRAMQSYALELMPELADLSSSVFKNEIQLLSDRVKTRKLLNKT